MMTEIRVLVQMAAGYHNACLAQNLAGEKDLYGMSYTTAAWPDPNTEQCDDHPISLQSSVTECAENVQCSARHDPGSPVSVHRSGVKSKHSDKEDWDEKLHDENLYSIPRSNQRAPCAMADGTGQVARTVWDVPKYTHTLFFPVFPAKPTHPHSLLSQSIQHPHTPSFPN
jgi:hypothetical protein